MTRGAAWRFWLRWALLSGICPGVSCIAGLVAAVFVTVLGVQSISEIGRFTNGLTGRESPVASLATFGLPLLTGAAIVGLAMGVATGVVQAMILPWPEDARQRWRRRSVVGWTVGVAAGCSASVTAHLFVNWLVGGIARGLDGVYLLESAAPVVGLVLGLCLRSAVPERRPGLLWWLAAHALATSAGWIVARAAVGATLFTGLAVGSLCYGAVSGLIMVMISRTRTVW